MPLAYFEVGIAHPHRHYARTRMAERGESPDGFPRATWAEHLERDYSGGAPCDAPFDLVPVIASTYGGWHPDFAAWLLRAAHGAVEMHGTGVAGGPPASAAGLLFRAAASLAIALQHGNSGVLAAAPRVGAWSLAGSPGLCRPSDTAVAGPCCGPSLVV